MLDFGGAGTDCGSDRLERRRHRHRECQEEEEQAYTGLFPFHRRSLTCSIWFTTFARHTNAAIGGRSIRLWNWSRTKGWYIVRAVMKAAKIAGAHATPKGLRHGFGIKAISCGVPLNTLQQLFGHAQLSTTSIYADAMGPEKRQLVERMWR